MANSFPFSFAKVLPPGLALALVMTGCGTSEPDGPWDHYLTEIAPHVEQPDPQVVDSYLAYLRSEYPNSEDSLFMNGAALECIGFATGVTVEDRFASLQRSFQSGDETDQGMTLLYWDNIQFAVVVLCPHYEDLSDLRATYPGFFLSR